MKNRNWLVLALCAMMGTGAVACGDDGGSSSGLKVTPESVELEAYIGTQSVEISGLPADTPIVVESMKPECAGVINVENLVSGLDGKASFVVVAAGNDCTAKVSVDANGETKNINVKVNASDGSAPTGDYMITLDPEILDISGAGNEANTKITYKQGNTVLGGRTLKVSKVGGEENCVEFSTSPVTNRSTGEVDFKVKALKDNCNVKLLVEDALPSIQGEHKELSVYVGGVTDGKVEGSVKFIEPVEDTLEIIYSVGTGKFKVEVIDENSQALANTKITLNNSNTECVKLKVKSITTGADGVAEGGVDVLKANCESTLTASAIGKEASITVKVLDQDKFNVKTKLVFNHPMYDMIDYAAVSLLEMTCDEWEATNPDAAEYKKLVADDMKENLDGNYPDLVTFEFNDIDATIKSVIAYAKANGSVDADILAYGCEDISVADHKQTVDINLSAAPIEIKGDYDLVANFDIAGAFTKNASTTLPAVEEMIADDWIKFVTDFFKSPIRTLIDFIWVNTVARLAGVEELGVVGDFIAKDGTRGIVADLLEPVIKDALKEYGWFTTILALTPDIEDLVSNMQLTGVMNVKETEVDNNKYGISEAVQSYNNLYYSWTLGIEQTCTAGYELALECTAEDGKTEIIKIEPEKEPETGVCKDSETESEPEDETEVCENAKRICYNFATNKKGNIQSDFSKCADVYGKDGSCRMRMPLTVGTHDASINGNWTGSIAFDETKNSDILNIEKHNIKLRWANILYMAVFGEILPKALKYSNETSVKNGTYIKAFLETLLFKPIVDSYENKRICYCACEGVGANETCTLKPDAPEGAKCNPALTQTQPCEKFIESLVYMAYSDASKVSSFIGKAASFACGPTGIEQLDKAVGDRLAELEVSVNTSANNCVLDSKATTQYMSMGEPDESAYSAGEVFENGSTIKSDRCTWNMQITSDNAIKGLFHATRID